jgi:hypothetical protein
MVEDPPSDGMSRVKSNPNNSGRSRFDEFLVEVRNLGLPPGDYAVFGSGPLAAAGLRDVDDIDLIVGANLWSLLAEQFPVMSLERGREMIQVGNIEIFRSWYPDVGDIHRLIREADLVDGIPFVKLHKVLEWKEKYGRPKDAHDIALIKSYTEGDYASE